jgi:hypothetical protein
MATIRDWVDTNIEKNANGDGFVLPDEHGNHRGYWELKGVTPNAWKMLGSGIGMSVAATVAVNRLHGDWRGEQTGSESPKDQFMQAAIALPEVTALPKLWRAPLIHTVFSFVPDIPGGGLPPIDIPPVGTRQLRLFDFSQVLNEDADDEESQEDGKLVIHWLNPVEDRTCLLLFLPALAEGPPASKMSVKRFQHGDQIPAGRYVEARTGEAFPETRGALWQVVPRAQGFSTDKVEFTLPLEHPFRKPLMLHLIHPITCSEPEGLLMMATMMTEDEFYAECVVGDGSARFILSKALTAEKPKTPPSVKRAAPRVGQSELRKQVWDAYGCCAVTRCSVKVACDTAHLLDYRGEDTQHVRNAIPLRKDIHALFDAGLLSIDTEYVVRVAKSIMDTSYALLDGQNIHLPENKADWPSREALHRRKPPHA